MKKRLLSIFFVSTILVAGCNGTQSSVTVQKNEQTTESNRQESSDSTPVAEMESQQNLDPQESTQTFNIGDTLTTDECEITIKNIEFSYDILPDDTSGFYTHYAADSGKVYIHIDTDVKNLQKQQMRCDQIMEVSCDYNDGYMYSGQAVPEDSASGGFSYANIVSIDPLETLGVRFLIDCPDEVATSENSVILNFKINGQAFEYQMK